MYKNKPYTAVWELTFACNMRCKHCGSSCDTALPSELTTEEALALCDDIGKLELHHVALSGGEPFLRNDIFKIAKRLSDNGVIPNIVTNGWFLTDEIVKKAKSAKISNIAISLDGGSEKTHDFFRTKGSFSKIMDALKILEKNNMPSSIITTVNKKNINELDAIYNLLVKKKVYSWQLQLITPMGNALNIEKLIVEPNQIEKIINFAYSKMGEKKIRIDIADNIGYYSHKTIELRSNSSKMTDFWKGCPAGKYSFGILADGNIVGCNSIRDKEYIEDNIRNRSIIEIWNDPNSFAWNRNLKKDDLTGFCSSCQFGSECLAGCSSMKQTTSMTVHETEYCVYKVAIDNERKEIEKNTNIIELEKKANALLKNEDYQLADIYFFKLLKKKHNDIKILNNLAFINFEIGNYSKSLGYSEQVISMEPDNSYALKGIGLCFDKLGNFDDAIKYLKSSIQKSNGNYIDAYYDLAIVFYNNNQIESACEILEEGNNKKGILKDKEIKKLYKMIKSELITD